MVKNQKGDVVVIIVVMLALAAILGLAFWAIFNTKKQSGELLKEPDTSQERRDENSSSD